jgi:hypothetical protein
VDGKNSGQTTGKTMNCTEKTFLKNVTNHEMKILRDDGVNRHIRFKPPASMNMQFDLVTWPGHLCYCGDMGTFVFSRLNDMFQFFRTDADSAWLKSEGLTLGINPSYWGEKLEAVDKGEGFKKFDDSKFDRIIKGILIQWVRDNTYRTTKSERRELWDEVMQCVIETDGDSGGYRKLTAAYDFQHMVNDRVGRFHFNDLWEFDFDEYTHRFIWCCYALAWGIKIYDASKCRGVPAD